MVEKINFEEIEKDFESAETVDEKEAIIKKIIESNIDLLNTEYSVSEIREKINEFKSQIQDHYDDMKVEEDQLCNQWIENKENIGLYRCIKSIHECDANRIYYIRIDDPAEFYRQRLEGIEDSKLTEYINNIKPLVWIILDNGIGTLKYRRLFTKDFTDYFEKQNF